MKFSRSFTLVTLCWFFSTGLASAGCIGTERLTQLEGQEMAYMLGRIPPAFRHAVEDHKISLQMQVDASGTSAPCSVKETLTIPQEDISEAARLLESDPAKRILLFSQGYSLPTEPKLIANFTVDPQSLQITHQDTLQVGELGKLRASVEMMYAMLSQARAETAKSAPSGQSWRSSFKLKTTETCKDKFRSKGEVQRACDCRSTELEKLYSERSMDHLDYVLSNPYAKATGAAREYSAQQETIHKTCGLIPG